MMLATLLRRTSTRATPGWEPGDVTKVSDFPKLGFASFRRRIMSLSRFFARFAIVSWSICRWLKIVLGGTAASHTCSGVGGGPLPGELVGNSRASNRAYRLKSRPDSSISITCLITRVLSCPKACRLGRRSGRGYSRFDLQSVPKGDFKEWKQSKKPKAATR